jgi:hypothetical protein
MTHGYGQQPAFASTPGTLAWTHLALGSAGVIAVSACYLLAPALAVSPHLGVDMTLARDAALSDRGYLQLVGVLGLLADPAIAVGALLLARSSERRHAIGMYWLAAAALLFTVVDALAGFALLAAAKASVATFSVAKGLFDAFTGCASVGYGLSAILIAWPPTASAAIGPTGLMLAFRLVGFVVASCGGAVLFGAAVGQPLGLGLAILTTLFTALGAWNIAARRRVSILP